MEICDWMRQTSIANAGWSSYFPLHVLYSKNCCNVFAHYATELPYSTSVNPTVWHRAYIHTTHILAFRRFTSSVWSLLTGTPLLCISSSSMSLVCISRSSVTLPFSVVLVWISPFLRLTRLYLSLICISPSSASLNFSVSLVCISPFLCHSSVSLTFFVCPCVFYEDNCWMYILYSVWVQCVWRSFSNDCCDVSSPLLDFSWSFMVLKSSVWINKHELQYFLSSLF